MQLSLQGPPCAYGIARIFKERYATIVICNGGVYLVFEMNIENTFGPSWGYDVHGIFSFNNGRN